MSDYWYFAAKDCKLRYGDDRIAKVGETHAVEGEIRLCENGLHASKRAIDALRLGGGPVVFKVKLSGDVVHDESKSASRERTYVAGGIDVTETLVEFACCVAEAAMLLAEHYDPRSWEAIEATRAYMRKEIEIGVLLEAKNAAHAAANAADDAAANAAYAAAYAAAHAANAAAYAAAYATHAEINDLLEQMLNEAIG